MGGAFDAQFFSEYPSKRKAGEIPPAYLMERIVGMNTQVVVAHTVYEIDSKRNYLVFFNVMENMIFQLMSLFCESHH